jgi:hypothetical protein
MIISQASVNGGNQLLGQSVSAGLSFPWAKHALKPTDNCAIIITSLSF